MPRILQMVKALATEAALPTVSGIIVRNFGQPGDAEVWLELRRRAFADEMPRAGDWDAAQFHREFTDKWWWRPEWMWFALANDSGAETPVGAITLAMRGESESAVPVVHWLAVLPQWRGRGIGRLLLATLEQEAWQQGYREIRLETHVGWQAAVRFYLAAGYQSSASS